MLVLVIVCVCWSAAFLGVFSWLMDKGNGYGRRGFLLSGCALH
jgi:hypothetical protein